ncbi:hypothetical protein BDR05DRAFT_1006602 [Suillus weaverae]|nr:hypothetical protein BDR05DRAFT_1006602 [Suillus weaverae]
MADLLLENLSKDTMAICPSPSHIKTLKDLHPLDMNPIPVPSMSSAQDTTPLANLMNVDEPPLLAKPGEVPQSVPQATHGHHHHRQHQWNQGRGYPSYHELPEIIYETSPSDLHVPPIEELATQKEAHAFTQMAQAEHKLEYAHLHTSPHLSLDNRRQSHANNCGRG